MNPEDKAKELFDKMCLAMATEKTNDGYFTNIIHAKKCALIAVDEILKNNKILFEDVLNDQYWENIKKEIEKL